MLAGCIIESGLAAHLKMYVPTDDRNGSHDLVGLLSVLLNRHVVRELGDAFFGKEAREQNVSLW
jgi:hypothetical protein